MTIAPRRHFTIPLPGRAPLELGDRTLVMGILNVTPDSFADGGRHFDVERAVARGLEMVAEGADIIDVGGESTRPGAAPVDEEEELRRVLPVVERLVQATPVPLSIDTYKARVAREAVARGAVIVNDVSNLRYDERLGGEVGASGAALVLMHNRGRSREMYREAAYHDVVGETARELRDGLQRATAAGVAFDRIILDPGFGFAKRAGHTFEALAGLSRLAALDRPILAGPSRKSFLQAATGERSPDDRDWATAAAVTASVLSGAHMVRVHAVRQMLDAIRVADRIRAASMPAGPPGAL
jgi:dihydropteroate synthase